MKKIVFYSFNGTTTSTLAALALAVPPDVEIKWLVSPPSVELVDSVSSIEEMGLQCIPSRYWFEEALGYEPDAILISSIYIHRMDFSRRYSSKRAREIIYKTGIPFFIHERGNTAKPDSNSSVERFRKEYKYFRATFTLGPLFHYTCRNLPTEKVLTGASKIDFYKWPLRFTPPTDKPFIVYCDTYCDTSWMNSKLSEPQKWVDILYQACQKLGYELVIKIHPCNLFMKRHKSWPGIIYTNSYYADLFKQATAIISDPSSVLTEALLLNKPLFLPEMSIGSWWQMDLLKPALYILKRNVDSAAKQIEEAIKNDRKKDTRRMLAKLWWYKPDGHASERIWEALLKRINSR